MFLHVCVHVHVYAHVHAIGIYMYMHLYMYVYVANMYMYMYIHVLMCLVYQLGICPLRLGNIHQVRGELREAVARYSAVLALQPHYLPALKGR